METFHVVMTPTYASKFPLGPPFFLAMGKSLFGYYAGGLWLCSALATAATTWMLLACFSNRWATGIGMCVASHPSWQSGWSQEFTHGWLPLAGISLVLGGTLRLHRLLRQQTAKHEIIAQRTWQVALVAIAFGCGLILFSRPFDGGIVCAMLVLSLVPPTLKWFRQPTQEWPSIFRFLCSTALPALSISIVFVGLQVVINVEVTGKWFQLPYQLHEKQYGVAPLFIWGTPNQPTLGHRFAELATYHQGYSLQSWNEARSVSGYMTQLGNRTGKILTHWGFGFAVVPMAILTWRKGRRRFGWLLVIAASALLVINLVPWVMPAYVASIIPLAILLFAFVLKRFATWIATRFHSTKTKASLQLRAEWATLLCLFSCQLLALSYTCYARASYQAGWEPNWAQKRQDIIADLNTSSESHLILVQYDDGHDVNEEWVYNEAELTNAKMVWGRFASADLNRQFIEGYPNRKVWLLKVPSGAMVPWGP